MTSKPLAIVLLLGCALFLISVPSSVAATKKKAARSDPALPTVEKVLRAEVAGEVDRRRQLAETLKQHPDSAAAHFQAGFVKDGNSWRSLEGPQRDIALAPMLDAYRHRRAEASLSFPGQLELADWCRASKLPDQERAHLLAALALGAGDASVPIAERLGYRRVSGNWLSPEQLLEWRELNRRAAQSLKKWESQLCKVAERVAGSPVQRELAIAGLKKIADHSA